MYRKPNVKKGKGGRYFWDKGSGRRGFASNADVRKYLGNKPFSPSPSYPKSSYSQSLSNNFTPIRYSTPSSSIVSKASSRTYSSYTLNTPPKGIEVKGGLYDDIFKIQMDNILYSQIKDGLLTKIGKSQYNGNDIIDIMERKINLMIRQIITKLEYNIGSVNFGGESQGIVPVGGTSQLRRTALQYLQQQIPRNRHFNFRLRLGFPVKYAALMNQKLTHQLRHYSGAGKYTIDGRVGSRAVGKRFYRRVISYDASGKEEFGYVNLNDTSAKSHFFEELLRIGRSEFSNNFKLIINRVEKDFRPFFDKNTIDFSIDRFIITPVGII